MRTIYAALLALLCAAPLHAQQTVVEKAKSDLAAAGFQVENKACSDFEIAKLVAGRLASQGAGLLQKDCCGDGNDPNRSHCELNGVWYAHDIVAFANGTEVDIAQDGGGRNGPQWDGPHPSDAAHYRAAAALGLTGLVPGQAPSTPPTCPPGFVFMDGATLHGCFAAGPPPTVPPLDYSRALQELLDSQHALADSQHALADAQQQLLALTTSIDAHVTNMDRTVAQTLGSIGKFAAKYLAPAIAGYIAAVQLQGNTPAAAAPAK